MFFSLISGSNTLPICSQKDCYRWNTIITGDTVYGICYINFPSCCLGTKQLTFLLLQTLMVELRSEEQAVVQLRWYEAQVPVAHLCNPSYSGGRDQEDWGSKPTQANSLWDPILKNSSQKRGWRSSSRCGPWVQAPLPHTHTHTHTKQLFSNIIPMNVCYFFYFKTS
jgi:hypothetical protein